jgi:hypothetical protein
LINSLVGRATQPRQEQEEGEEEEEEPYQQEEEEEEEEEGGAKRQDLTAPIPDSSRIHARRAARARCADTIFQFSPLKFVLSKVLILSRKFQTDTAEK